MWLRRRLNENIFGTFIESVSIHPHFWQCEWFKCWNSGKNFDIETGLNDIKSGSTELKMVHLWIIGNRVITKGILNQPIVTCGMLFQQNGKIEEKCALLLKFTYSISYEVITIAIDDAHITLRASSILSYRK